MGKARPRKVVAQGGKALSVFIDHRDYPGRRMHSKSGKYKVADLTLASEGKRLIEWAESRMPVLMAIRNRYRKTKPLRGFRIAGCLHVTKETGVLVRTFVEAGADVSWSGCNPLSTNDAVASALAADGISIFAWHGMSVKEFYWCI